MLKRIKCFFISCYDFVFGTNKSIKGKCPMCKHNTDINCIVGKVCYSRGLWESNES